jgi:hypothetical protein
MLRQLVMNVESDCSTKPFPSSNSTRVKSHVPAGMKPKRKTRLRRNGTPSSTFKSVRLWTPSGEVIRK